jgi:hypothetical protein
MRMRDLQILVQSLLWGEQCADEVSGWQTREDQVRSFQKRRHWVRIRRLRNIKQSYSKMSPENLACIY